jgi:tRNA threonylcarbamoyladenosine biosynthesis protein TsaB
MNGALLAIDAATYVGTVAIVHDGLVVAEGETAMRGEREERLLPAVIDALDRARLSAGNLAAIACGAGPGSFTSLRIAASIAKGLAFALGVPLLCAPSLALIVSGQDHALPAGRYLATLDAMRGDLYAQLFIVHGDGEIQSHAGVERVSAVQMESRAAALGAMVVGPGVGDANRPHARGVGRLVGGTLLTPVDLAAWEPNYGRLAEAQVKWEQAHGRSLGTGE